MRLQRSEKQRFGILPFLGLWMAVVLWGACGGLPVGPQGWSDQWHLAAAEPQPDELVIAAEGQTTATVAVSPNAGEWEKLAAADLVRCIQGMTGAAPRLANTAETIAAARTASTPVFFVGQAALETLPALKEVLAKTAKPQPLLQADAIVLRRQKQQVFLAGTNDESHYYAVAELLRRWGCRWYLPTEFGECLPRQPRLMLGALDVAYAPPFEIRRYWLSWNGDTTGQREFQRRNFMNDVSVPSGHALHQYTKDLVPPGKTMFNVPIAEPSTAEHVARQLEGPFSKGEKIMLGLEDGIYESDSPADLLLKANLRDKYFLSASLSDAFLTFYNGVADRLLQKHPQSQAMIGFLAYANITIPPQRKLVASKPLVAYLAPIDVDPIHGMDDPRSPPRQEYREMLYRWAEVMQGRLAIYDYDQGMLVWRDLPNPSHEALRQDIHHYRKAGILGVDTESRGAMATTFLNLYLRGQLYWNPDADIDALLAEFYPKFYGPAAEPMSRYWGAIYDAWKQTPVTEHEFFVSPAIYTPALVARLEQDLVAAEKAAASQSSDRRLAERMQFTRLGYEILKSYTEMTQAAATECDYRRAVAAGERGLAAREALTALNGTFTTYKTIGESGYAWWPGEVQQMRELLEVADGPKGKLIAKLPLEWSFRRDLRDSGLAAGWAKQTPDLKWWNTADRSDPFTAHRLNPGHWETVRSDLYLQAQGIVDHDYQAYNGYGWYHTPVELSAADAQGKVHLRFPGLFNECWLYVNGYLAAHRPQREPWWYNDYRFEWDVDLAGQLQPGQNSLVVRINNPHHAGGMFRRPFLYRAP